MHFFQNKSRRGNEEKRLDRTFLRWYFNYVIGFAYPAYRPMRLSDFIVAQKESILQVWEDFARSLQPPDRTASSKELRNHGAQVLEAIATDLRSPQTGDEQSEKSQGHGPWNSEDAIGAEHGSTRIGIGFSIEDVVAEYRALRAAVLRLWNTSNTAPLPTDAEDITRFNEAIDRLLAASVSRFAHEARQAIEEKERRKDDFLAILAHELRNPLAPITSGASLLKVFAHDEKRLHSISEIIGRQANYLNGLLDDLLDISRITRGLIELKAEPQDMEQVIADAIEQVNPVLHSYNHLLKVHAPPTKVSVVGDRKRLVQVIANLLHNAAKYTPPGGSIAVTTALTKDEATITVEDNGIGMTPELAASAFDMFAQGSPASGHLAEGLGLGLAVVKRLVELHGGNVSCSSEGPGKGSRFTVSLPLLADVDSTVKQPETETEIDPVADKSGLKILIVDDNADAAELLGMVLKIYGHEILIEHQPEHVPNLARSELPNACLLDIGMPGINGNELARRLRNQPETANVLLVAITGYGQERDIQESRAAGFDHHITKPVDVEKLLGIFTARCRS